MADIIISDLPVIVSSTADDFFIINDGNTTTAIISQANLFGSVSTLQTVGFDDGTALAPSITFTSDPNVGIYKPAPDSWAVATNGVQRLVIDDGGRVGINQTSPGAWFSGSNNLVVGDPTLGDNGITIVSSTTEVGNISFADGTTNGDTRRGLIRYDHTDDHMRFDTSSTEAMRIDEDGNVLVGVTAMTSGVRFSVEGGSIGSIDGTVNIPGYTFQDDTDTGIWRKSDDTFSIATAGVERITVESSGQSSFTGNVYIGGNLPLSPNIFLNTDGSITAAGNIQSGGDSLTGDNDGIIIAKNGTSYFSAASNLSTINSYTTGNNTPTFQVSAAGSATFAGLITCDDRIRVNAGGSFDVYAEDDTYYALRVYNVAGTVSAYITSGGSINAAGTGDFGSSVTIAGNLNLTGAGTPGPELSTPAANTIALKPDGSIERIRVDESGAIGLSGANYGVDGQVLTSQGPGVAPAWVSFDVGGIPDISTLTYLP